MEEKTNAQIGFQTETVRLLFEIKKKWKETIVQVQKYAVILVLKYLIICQDQVIMNGCSRSVPTEKQAWFGSTPWINQHT